MSDASDRTFDPTPKRREEFRKDGRFPRARDLGGVAAAIAVLGALALMKTPAKHAWTELFVHTLGRLERPHLAAPEVVPIVIAALTVVLVPTLLAAALAGFGAGVVQAGFRIDTKAFEFKPDRLNPLPRLLEVFAPKRGIVETIMSLLRVGLVGYVTYRAIKLELPLVLGLGHLPLAAGVESLVGAASRVFLTAIGTLAAVAAVDYGYSYWKNEKDLKMTRQELMDETRADDGDPKNKARMRGRARAIARKRALNSVKSADVIVTNPTHVAVALRYSDADAAPVVLAKGHDDVALAIRREARKHGIPIVENRPLARALDAAVPVGKAIPAMHFLAVAKILAFVFQLKKRR